VAISRVSCEGTIAVVLTLGTAMRLRPLSLGAPKSLVHFCNRPLVEYTLETLAHHQIPEIVLVTGPCDEESHRYTEWAKGKGVTIHVAQRGLQFGSGGVLTTVFGEARGRVHTKADYVLVIMGDSLWDEELPEVVAAHEQFRERGGALTIVCHTPDDLIVPGAKRTSYGVADLSAEGRVERFQEKPLISDVSSPLASTGMVLLDLDALHLFPRKRPCDLASGVIASLANGSSSPVFGHLSAGFRYDLGTLESYRQIQLEVVKGNIPVRGIPDVFSSHRRPSLTRCSIDGPVVIGTDCSIADTAKLVGPAVVGDRVSIGDNAEIVESVVCECTEIGPRVKIAKSIVGPSVRIGAGCVLAENSVLGGWSTLSTKPR